jgi:hypothetical protein
MIDKVFGITSICDCSIRLRKETTPQKNVGKVSLLDQKTRSELTTKEELGGRSVLPFLGVGAPDERGSGDGYGKVGFSIAQARAFVAPRHPKKHSPSLTRSELCLDSAK